MRRTAMRPNQPLAGSRAHSSRRASRRSLPVALTFIVLAASGCAASDTAEDAPEPQTTQTTQAAATAVAEPATVRDAIDDGAKIIDVRTPEEFASGHLQGAVNIDLSAADFDERIAALDETASYVVYCASGNRAGTAIEAMRAQGLDDLVNGGGYEDLAASGLPTT